MKKKIELPKNTSNKYLIFYLVTFNVHRFKRKHGYLTTLFFKIGIFVPNDNKAISPLLSDIFPIYYQCKNNVFSFQLVQIII